MPGSSARPPPQCWPANTSGGSCCPGRVGRGLRRWDGASLLLPLPCKATCTPLPLWLVGQENVFFQEGKRKRENTTSTKTKSQELRGAESRTMSSSKLGMCGCLQESPGMHAPSLKQRMKGCLNQWLEWEMMNYGDQTSQERGLGGQRSHRPLALGRNLPAAGKFIPTNPCWVW